MEDNVYTAVAEAFIKSLGLKEGDKVKILRGSFDGELGWPNSWEPSMNEVVGTIQTIQRITKGFELTFEDIGMAFPAFIVDNTNLPSSIPLGDSGYDVTFDPNGTVRVGCQTISREKVLELAKMLGEY